MKTHGRLVWAVNPFEDESAYFKHALKVIDELAAAAGLEVEPAFVLAPPRLMLPVGETFRVFDPVTTEMEKRWPKLMGGAPGDAHFLDLTLIRDEGASIRSAARTLAAHAVAVGAEGIAVATHGRRGIRRALMGSFAESLLHQATLPTLVINPRAGQGTRVKTILFPVDPPLGSHRPFGEVLAFAKWLKANLVLYHKLDYAADYATHFLLEAPVYSGYVTHDVKSRKKAMAGLRREAVAAGVSTEVIFDEGYGYVVDRILSMAKRCGADLIALVSRSGQAEAALLGSVSRQVTRAAPCPVWVVRAVGPKAKRAVAFKPEVLFHTSAVPLKLVDRPQIQQRRQLGQG